MRFFARLRIQRLDGPMYTEHRACRSCPRCQKFLPYGFEIDPSFNIALVGNNISGKTHYLAALLHQLKNGELAQGGDVYVNFTPLNKEAEQKFYEYDQRLFKERKGLDNTPRYTQPIHQNKVAMMEPLIFRLEIGYQEQRQPIRNVMNLVFYDISGEDISKPNVMSQFLWPISEAQGIIYVADPLQMENIVAGILAEQPSNQQAQNVQKILGGMLKVHEVLDNIIQVFMRYNKLSSRNSVTTPIAIMLSKSDVLDTIAQKHHFQDAIFLKNGTYYGTTDPGDIATVNKDVQLLLRQFKEQRLIHASLRFLHVSFFATSATGCAPSDTGKYLEYKEVKPRRCLDPLIWLLWKLSPSNSSLYR